jgi:hypothetical protein
MKVGLKKYLFLGIVGAFIFLINLIELLIGQGDQFDVLEAFFFLLFSAENFITYFRVKGKTQFHFIS